MTRRSLALAALAVCSLVLPAQAQPSAGPESGAALAVQLKTSSGAYLLQLLASRPAQGGTPMLRLRLMPQGGSAQRFGGELAATAFSMSGGTATLQARLGGQPLQVVWSPDGAIVGASLGGLLAGNGFDIEGWSIAGTGGTARFRLGRIACATDSVVLGPAFAYRTETNGTALSRGLGLDLRGARCGPPPTTQIP